METKIIYYDESGDEGCNTSSSSCFVLTAVYMYASDWQENFNLMRNLKIALRNQFHFPINIEMHTKHFLTDKLPYRNFNWSYEDRRQILHSYFEVISQMKIETVNIIIDKTNIDTVDYPVLENALTYSLQRIDTTSLFNGEWNYIVISDKGRVKKMKKTARRIRVYNPVINTFDYSTRNLPIKYMIEDIIEKDSSDSYFIQTADFISYFVHLFYLSKYKNQSIPNRVQNLISPDEIEKVMRYFKHSRILNLKAAKNDSYGLVIYPK